MYARTIGVIAGILTIHGCVGQPPEAPTDLAGPVTAEAGDEGKADGGELRVRAGDMTLWVDRHIDLASDGGELVATLRAHTSRNLVAALAWVPDDAFGTTAIVGPRSFTVTLRGGHEINTVLSGLPLFVSIDVLGDRHYDARILAAPRLGDFAGASELWLDSVVTPVYVRDASDPLRYRMELDADDMAGLTVGGVTDSTVTTIDGGATIDLPYAALDAALGSGSRLTLTTAAGAEKSAGLEARATWISLTTGDPLTVWPATECTPTVMSCIVGDDGFDLAGCGDYREVSSCMAADVCDVLGAAALTLDPLDLGIAFDAARADYVAHCDGGGQWCRLDDVRTFSIPRCAPASLEEIVDILLADSRERGADDFAYGRILDRTNIAGTPFFASSYSSGGPGLFSTIDGHMGGGAIEGWHLENEIACHNCTDFGDTLVLWYVDAARVVVLDGGHGYDS